MRNISPLLLSTYALQAAHAQSLGGSGSSLFSDSLMRKGQVQTVLEHKPVTHTECRQATTGPIETTTCDYETVESVNDELYHHLNGLVKTPFFKFFRVDLYRDCPFWQEKTSCMNEACSVPTLDESEIPEKWRAASLSKLNVPLDERVVMPGCYSRDSDFCFLDDETEGDYVDLIANPERYTGYAGPSAARVWRSIYEENCFGLSEMNLLMGKGSAPVTLPDTMMDPFRDETGEARGTCLEKRVYYKIISGLHASISTHICNEYLDTVTGEYKPDLACFINRVAAFPERLQYIYFDTVLLLRAVARIAPYLTSYDYCSTGTSDDSGTTAKLKEVTDIATRVGAFDETVLFRGENAAVLKEEFKTHFRNVSRIMDCVGCGKCQLWGKIQTTGLATAMKILFELDELALNPVTNPNLLQRSEVVALINTLHRMSESLYAVENFRRMWAETDEDASEKLIQGADRAVEHAARGKSSDSDRESEQAHNSLTPLESFVAAFKRLCARVVSYLQLSDKSGFPTSDNDEL